MIHPVTEASPAHATLAFPPAALGPPGVVGGFFSGGASSRPGGGATTLGLGLPNLPLVVELELGSTAPR